MFNINFARDSAPATDDDIQAALKWVTSAIHSEHGATKEIALLLSKLVLRIDESKAEILALKSDLTNCMNAASAEAELADEFKAELDALKAIHQPQGALCKVVEANRELLLKRANKGMQTYGVTLEQANLSEADLAQHALEEALDLANYLQAFLQKLAIRPAMSDETIVAAVHAANAVGRISLTHANNDGVEKPTDVAKCFLRALSAQSGGQKSVSCNQSLREAGLPYPRTCGVCHLGPCQFDRSAPVSSMQGATGATE